MRLFHRTIVTILVVAAYTTLSPSAFAQHGPNDGPNWDYDESYTDQQKLERITRKAHYERQRAESFAQRGIKGYEPTRESLKIALPTTARAGNRRLEQLNRIARHADDATRIWIDYEFDVVKKQTLWLISNGR